MMATRILCLAVVAFVSPLLAQPTLPPLPSRPDQRTREGPDPLVLYGGAQDAALAAFHKGVQAAETRNPDRAMRLMLLALQRSPHMEKALYNLGVLCAQTGRWDDAVKFQHEVQSRAPGSEAAKLAVMELRRLDVVAPLEKTSEGHKQREYDRQLLNLLSNKDSIKRLEGANELSRKDATRWEGFALAGIEYAATRDYAKAQQALATAVSLAPEERRHNVQSAADMVHTENEFTRQVNEADEFWSNHQYDKAAKAYADAWETKPGRSNVGMRAATGFLLVDQVDLAVMVLSRMRASAPPEVSAKTVAMLRELSAVSEDAKRALAGDTGSDAIERDDSAARFPLTLEMLKTEDVEIAVRPEPKLLSDSTVIVGEASLAAQDSGINAREVFYESKTGIFGLYQANLVPVQPAPPETPPPAPVPPSPTFAQPPPQPQALQPPQPPALPPAAPRGENQPVDVSTVPSQASVILDHDERPVNCTSPCRVWLSPGRHTMLARLPGYRDGRKIFEVSKTMKPVEMQLEARYGTVNIESIPSQLPIYVNGSKINQKTPWLLPLNEGTYKVAVEYAGKMVSKDVTVHDGDILTTTIPAGPQ